MYGRIKTEMIVKAVLFVSAVIFFRVYVQVDGHVEEDRQVAVFVWYAFEIHRTAKMNKNYANFTISARQ